ncbi:MAG: hypothetical protein KAV87_21635, partial [Desulfobacteraceae bacterium]|nr:hypothetical protein [Desulfobacteraceae bacterium]
MELTYNASGSPCPPPPAPDNPDPCDGAIEVPIDTCLSWNGGSGGGPGTCVVVPNANISVEGNSNNGYPFNLVSSMRYQQIYDAAEVGQSGVITEIRFRPDATTGDPFSSANMDVEIFLGYAATSVLAPSGTFADNIGSGYVKVYDGIMTLSSDAVGGPPRNFDIIVNVDDIFEYDPANGPLLLDIKLYNSPGSTQFDAVGEGIQNTTTRIYSIAVDSPTGAVNGGGGSPYGLVTMFCFDGAIPVIPSWSNVAAVDIRDPNTYEVDPETGTMVNSATLSLAPEASPEALTQEEVASGLSPKQSEAIISTLSELPVVASFPAPSGYCRGMCFDGMYLYTAQASSSDYIYKLNPATGSVVQTYSAPSTFPIGLAWDGTNFYVSGDTDSVIHVTNTSFSQVRTLPVPETWGRDMAW